MVSSAVVVLIFLSFDWAKWGDYRKCDKVEYDTNDGKDSYCKKGDGCPKGYEYEAGDKCKKCKDANYTKDDGFGNQVSIKYSELCANLNKYAPDENQKKNLESGDNTCYCKKNKVKAASCPSAAKAIDDRRKENCKKDGEKNSKRCTDKKYYKTVYKNCKENKDYDGKEEKGCKESLKEKRAQYHYHGCLYAANKGRNSYWSVWAFILILVIGILAVIAIIAVIIFLIVKLSGGGGSKTSQVTPANSSDVTPANANEDGTTSDKAIHDRPVEGPYVVIKMGDKELSTKKVANGPVLTWGETVVFDTLGNEDEDATFDLRGTNSPGTHTLRILDYVNNKTRVPLTLKNSEGADVGVLEVDIEIKAEGEPPKVSGIYFVDKYNGPGNFVIQKEEV